MKSAGPYIALALVACLALPNRAEAEVPPPPADSSSAVPALVEVRPARLRPRVDPEPVELVIDAVRRADVAMAEGDRVGSIAILHAAERADRRSQLLHVARLAYVHHVRPGVALDLGAGQIRAVLDMDRRANLAHTAGFVVGGLGALAGIFGVASLVWGGVFYRPLTDADWSIAGGLWGVGGVLALVAIGFHIEGLVRDGEVRAMLQLAPSSSGASSSLSARF